MALESSPPLTAVAAPPPAARYAAAGRSVDIVLLAIGALLGAALAWLLLIYGEVGGNLFAPVLALALIIVGPIVWRRPVYGLYILMGAAVAIEENPLGFGSALTDQLPFFRDINGIITIRGIWLNSAEVVMVIIALAWITRNGAASARPRLEPGPIFLPFTAFMAILAFGVMHGVLAGGDLKISLWTVRPLAYFFLTYVLTVHIVRNRGEVNVLMSIFVAGVILKGVVGWWRYYADLDMDLSRLDAIAGVNSLMAHEESFFFLAVILLAVVQLLYGSPGKQRVLALSAMGVVLLPLLANQRRASSLALLVGLLALFLITYGLLRERRRLLLGLLVVGAVAMPIYGAVFWNSTSLIAEPVQAIKSGFEPDERDDASNAYREAENVNLEFTVRESPIVGIGFGKEMVMHWPLPDIGEFFAWYTIVPHNTILWVMMTTGIVGFIAFWYWIGVTFVQGCLAARRLVERQNLGLAVYGITMLAAMLVVALYDQGLLSMRITIFMGILVGLTMISPRLERRQQDEQGEPTEDREEAATRV